MEKDITGDKLSREEIEKLANVYNDFLESMLKNVGVNGQLEFGKMMECLSLVTLRVIDDACESLGCNEVEKRMAVLEYFGEGLKLYDVF